MEAENLPQRSSNVLLSSANEFTTSLAFLGIQQKEHSNSKGNQRFLEPPI